MKKIKLNKYLSLLLVPVFLMALLTPVNAFASQTGDSMEVAAHIEAPSNKPPSSSNIDSDPIAPQTGNNNNLTLWLFLLFISFNALVVLLVCEKRKNTPQNKL